MPAQNLMALSKDMCTPASITCVEMHITLREAREFAALLFLISSSAVFISFRISRRCWIHIEADKWNFSHPSMQIWSKRYEASFFLLQTISRLLQPLSKVWTNAGVSSNEQLSNELIVVRRNSSRISLPQHTISPEMFFSGKRLPSKVGCVAEDNTMVALHTVWRKFIAELNSDSIFTGTVCTSSMTMMLSHNACSLRTEDILPENKVFRNWTMVVIMIGECQVSV